MQISEKLCDLTDSLPVSIDKQVPELNVRYFFCKVSSGQILKWFKKDGFVVSPAILFCVLKYIHGWLPINRIKIRFQFIIFLVGHKVVLQYDFSHETNDNY
jgi:hypothetical protein